MSSPASFAAEALQHHIAPPSIGSVKARIRHASRKLRWSTSRTKDAWYSDPRIALRADELRAIEEVTGLKYGKQQLWETDRLIAAADALLAISPADFRSAFLAALRSLAGDQNRSGTGG